jgi:peroxiredoxin
MLKLLKTFAKRLLQPRAQGLLKVGAPAPDFDVLDHLGHRHRLADYRGKKLVLWFYPKAATPG